MEATLDLVRQRVETLAEEYRGEGYEVIVEPSQTQLPPFLAGYHPDLLLHKASESVVVDVRARKSLAKDSQVRELAGLLRAQTGWSFELVLVDVREQISAPEDARPFTSKDIMHGAAEAEHPSSCSRPGLRRPLHCGPGQLLRPPSGYSLKKMACRLVGPLHPFF